MYIIDYHCISEYMTVFDMLLQAVEELLHALSATGEEEVSPPSGYYSQQPTMRLREALLHCYDLR